MFLTLLILATAAPAAEPKSLLDDLTIRGLDIPGKTRFKVQPPWLGLGMTSAQKREVVEKFADEYPRGLFLERNVTAPYPVRVKPIWIDPNKEDKWRGHTLDVCFVAHGKIEKLESEDILGSLMGMRRKGEAKAKTYLSDKELAARGIVPAKTTGLEERYVLLDMTLVEKVHLSGVMKNQKTTVDGSLISMMVLDERFLEDKEYPNRWRPVLEGKGDSADLGRPERYTGFGGYAKVTPIPGIQDALFIELHFAFHEPHAWFDGRNILASKLPVAVRNNVKQMRNKLSGRPGR